jgi:hypothetical protein
MQTRERYRVDFIPMPDMFHDSGPTRYVMFHQQAPDMFHDMSVYYSEFIPDFDGVFHSMFVYYRYR